MDEDKEIDQELEEELDKEIDQELEEELDKEISKIVRNFINILPLKSSNILVNWFGIFFNQN